jgi:Mn2+/Fe2+ NRAMP family transporter
MSTVSLWRRLRLLAASIGPGIFMIGYIIGTGSVTSMSQAGATYGMSLVWTLILASLFNHIRVVALSRLTMLSGETTLRSFRRGFGAPVTLFLIAGMAGTQLTSIIGVTAIVADVIRQFSLQMWETPVPTLATAIVITSILLGLFWVGRHQFFLRVLAGMVAVMGVAFVFTAIKVAPDMGSMARGILPASAGENPELLLAGMIGTTMASVVLFTRAILVQEKGWTMADYHEVVRDSTVANTLLFFLNAAIMACAAGTLYLAGTPVTLAIDMVRSLEPLAGNVAVVGFTLGLVAAGMSSLFPGICWGPGWRRTLAASSAVTKPSYRLMVVGAALLGLVVPIFGGRPVPLMIASQAVSPLVMPLMAVFVWILVNKTSFVGDRKPSALLNFSLGVTVLFTLYAAYLAVAGFLGSL